MEIFKKIKERQDYLKAHPEEHVIELEEKYKQLRKQMREARRIALSMVYLTSDNRASRCEDVSSACLYRAQEISHLLGPGGERRLGKRNKETVVGIYVMMAGWGIKPESWGIIIFGAIVQLILSGLIVELGKK
jgi:hypothetical protein